VSIQIDGTAANDRKIVDAFDGMRWILFPLTVDPGPNLDKFTEIDLWIEVRGEIFAVAAGIDIQYVNRVDLVEITPDRQCTVGVDYARIKPRPQDSRQESSGQQ